MEYRLRAPTNVIGRDPRTDIPLPRDPKVSRHHAEIRREGPAFVLYDQNSTNGTHVNGRRVTRHVLRDGDRIRVGRTELVFRQGSLLLPAGIVPEVGSQQQRLSAMPVAVGAFVVVLIIALLVASGMGGPSKADASQVTAVPTMRTPITPMVTLSPTTTPTATLTPTPTVTPSPTTTPTVTPTPTRTMAQVVERAQRATVMIVVLDDFGAVVSLGSGSIVDSRGLVLTNFHVIGDEDLGKPYNREGMVGVGITTSADAPPDPWYLAELLAWDVDLDLAVLHIVADEDGNPLSGPLRLPTISLGDSDALHLGDRLFILGYPASGVVNDSGEWLVSITLTQGIVSGFGTRDDGIRLWIKTDTEVSRGNSGGVVINDQGELVGVPTRISPDIIKEKRRESAKDDAMIMGKLGLIRPINMARPLIERAQAGL